MPNTQENDLLTHIFGNDIGPDFGQNGRDSDSGIGPQASPESIREPLSGLYSQYTIDSYALVGDSAIFGK